MQGKVKWFSDQKGYGYIVADDGNEHYFNVHDVQGADLPHSGDVVGFTSGQGKKGLKASSVSIVSKGQAAPTGRHTDDRVTCQHCDKKMVPRMLIYQGAPTRSLCPFCGGIYKDFTKKDFCFIATAVYRNAYAPEVIALRRFRDETLQPRMAGRIFIAAYYRLSPPVATFLSSRPILAAPVKKLLDMLARRHG